MASREHGRLVITGNALDRLLQRFQHRWETDRQWRAAMGGVLALVVLVGLCGAVFSVSNVAQGVLVGMGFGSTGGSPKDGGAPDTGAKLVNGVYTFPTPVVTWTVGTVPAVSPIPNSSTPQPVPTSAVTPTTPPSPSPSPTSGGGGGGPAQCSGGNSQVTFSFSPCPQVHGQSGMLSIIARGYPNAPINVVLNLNGSGSCGDCTMLFTPDQGYKLSSSGTAGISYTVPADAAGGSPPASNITGMIEIQATGNPGTEIVASPVQ